MEQEASINEDWMVFRRFDEYNLLNLLLLQGELQKLTEQLKDLCSKAGAEPSAVETAWYAPPSSSAARGGIRAATEAERQQWFVGDPYQLQVNDRIVSEAQSMVAGVVHMPRGEYDLPTCAW